MRGSSGIARAASLAALILALAAGAALAADAGDYARSFEGADFKANRDSLRIEEPLGGAVRVTPRLNGSDVWTTFAVPQEHESHAAWEATAVVTSSAGSAAGAAIWDGASCWAAAVRPDGSGFLRRYENRKMTWSQPFELKGFSLPATVTVWRDANGSVMARVNGVAVAARVYECDFGEMKGGGVTAVSLLTASSAAGEAVTYERLIVSGAGRAARKITTKEKLFGPDADSEY